MGILASAKLCLVLIQIDTLIATSKIFVESGIVITKRRNLAPGLSLQVAVVAYIEANGWERSSHGIPPVKRDYLDVLLASEFSLGFLRD